MIPRDHRSSAWSHEEDDLAPLPRCEWSGPDSKKRFVPRPADQVNLELKANPVSGCRIVAFHPPTPTKGAQDELARLARIRERTGGSPHEL